MNKQPIQTISPFHYDQTSATWKIASNTNTSIPLQKNLKIVTYNVLFPSIFGFVSELVVRSATRYALQMEMLEQLNADVICLNEVVPWYVSLLMEQKWVQNGYFLSDICTTANAMHNGSLGVTHGCFILSKLPIQQLSTVSILDLSRKAIVAQYADSSCICAVHLTAYAENIKKRDTELSFLVQQLQTISQDCILLGDLNLHAPEEKQLFEKHNFVDVWPMMNGDELGYTYDAQANWLIKTIFATFEKRQMRLDRILLSSKCSWQPCSKVQMIGTEGVAWDYLFPSDHFGLTVQLKK